MWLRAGAGYAAEGQGSRGMWAKGLGPAGLMLQGWGPQGSYDMHAVVAHVL